MPLQTIRYEDEFAGELEPVEEGNQHIHLLSREMRPGRDHQRWIIATFGLLALLVLVSAAGAWMWRSAQIELQDSADDLGQVALKFKKHKKKKEASKKEKGVCIKAFHQCGGTGFEEASCCESGCICMPTNDFYSQCSPPDKAAACDPTLAKAKLDNWTKEAEIAQQIADNATGHLGWLEEQVNKMAGSSEWWTKKAAKSADEMGHAQWQMNEAAILAAGNFSVEDGCSSAQEKCSGKGDCCQKGCDCVDMGGWSQCHAASKGASCWESGKEQGKALHAQRMKEFEVAKAAADKDAAALESRNKDLDKFKADKELAVKDAQEKEAKAKKYNDKVQKWKEAFEGEAKAKAAAKVKATASMKKHSATNTEKKKKVAHKDDGDASNKEEVADNDKEADDDEEEEKEEEEDEAADDKEGDQEDDDETEEDIESSEKDAGAANSEKYEGVGEEDGDWANDEYGEEDE